MLEKLELRGRQKLSGVFYADGTTATYGEHKLQELILKKHLVLPLSFRWYAFQHVHPTNSLFIMGWESFIFHSTKQKRMLNKGNMNPLSVNIQNFMAMYFPVYIKRCTFAPDL